MICVSLRGIVWNILGRKKRGKHNPRNDLNKNLPLIRVNFVKTELNHKELNDFINLWKDKVDMIGIQEFVKPTKVTKEITKGCKGCRLICLMYTLTFNLH